MASVAELHTDPDEKDKIDLRLVESSKDLQKPNYINGRDKTAIYKSKNRKGTLLSITGEGIKTRASKILNKVFPQNPVFDELLDLIYNGEFQEATELAESSQISKNKLLAIGLKAQNKRIANGHKLEEMDEINKYVMGLG